MSTVNQFFHSRSSVLNKKKQHNFFSSAVDDCQSSPCSSKGVCENQVDGFRCQCKDGWSGITCKAPDLCYQHQCQNEGVCVPNGDNYTCTCGQQHSGDRCELNKGKNLLPATTPFSLVPDFVSRGSGYIAQLVECCTCDRKVASLNPGRSAGRIFFSRVNFLFWLLLGVRSTPLLLQWHVKDPRHSAKGVGGRLHLNMHTLLTQQSLNGMTMLSRHTVEIFSLTTRQGMLTEPLWTYPDLESGVGVHKLIST